MPLEPCSGPPLSEILNPRPLLEIDLNEREPYLTFINTDSLSFSLLTILMATFFPETQWTPSLTKPETTENEHFS